MILVESGARPLSESDTLRSMFRARKEVFVDLLKWNVSVFGGEFEIDSFDDEQAEYLVITNDKGEHLGSVRLLKTTGSHILGSLFPFLCSKEVPSGPGILEITRFCLDRHQHAPGRRLTRNRLVSALVTFALERGIHTYTGVAEMAWLQQILAFGWRCRPLGTPRQHAGGMLGALAIEIDSDTPLLLAANGIWVPEPLTDFELANAA